jgi:death-on-curing protein
MIDRFGGIYFPPDNIKNRDQLSYLVEAVQGRTFGVEMYPRIELKAALYMFNIIQNHIFHDGNKRTGLATAMLFLDTNGVTLKPKSHNNLIEFTLATASGDRTLEEIEFWFRNMF